MAEEKKVTITMLTDQRGADGEALKKGSSYALAEASANRWLKRGHATKGGVTEAAAADTGEEEQDPGSMTKAQLGEALDAKGIEHSAKMTKAELQDLLDQAGD